MVKVFPRFCLFGNFNFLVYTGEDDSSHSGFLSIKLFSAYQSAAANITKDALYTTACSPVEQCLQAHRVYEPRCP